MSRRWIHFITTHPDVPPFTNIKWSVEGWQLAINYLDRCLPETGCNLFMNIVESQDIQMALDACDAASQTLDQHAGRLKVHISVSKSKTYSWQAAGVYQLAELASRWARGVESACITFDVGPKSLPLMWPKPRSDQGPARLIIITGVDTVNDLLTSIIPRNSDMNSLCIITASQKKTILASIHLPDGLTTDELRVPEGMLTRLTGLCNAPNIIDLYLEVAPDAYLVKRLQQAYIGPNTMINAGLFEQPPQERRIRRIRYKEPADVIPAYRWRTRRLDLHGCEAQRVHCDAVVVATSHRGPNSWPAMTGTDHLLVAQTFVDVPDYVEEALQDACQANPTAHAWQTVDYTGTKTTVFKNNAMPHGMAPLMDLVMALGIADGDNGERAKASVEATMDALAAAGLQSSTETQYKVLKQIAFGLAGAVRTMADIGLG